MKYIMFFEAFKSESLSKISSFLRKKIGKDEYDKFIKSLIYIGDMYDLPISNIKEDEVEYLNKKKAIKVNPKGDNDITTIKFWFSIDKGYLGYTGTGNKSKLSSKEIYFLRDERGIKTGELSPVLDYSSLKTGEIEVGYFSSNLELSRLAKATIYLFNNRIYAIQDVADGNSPPQHVQDWKIFGDYSWMLRGLEHINSDHIKLNHYKESDKDLGYYTKIELTDENYLDINLPISGDILISWGNSSIYTDVIDNADFAIILHINKILNRGYKKRSYIESERQNIKSGSHKFMSDDDFRKININNYISRIISKMGFEKDKTINDIKNLQKIVLLVLCDDNALYTIYGGDPELSWISRFSIKIKELFYSKNNEDSKYNLDQLRYIYNKLYKLSVKKKIILSKSKKTISQSSNPRIREISSKVDDINKNIYDYFKKIKIDNISDLKMVMHKLEYIYSLLSDEGTKLVEFERIFIAINNVNRISSLMINYDDIEYRKDELEDDIKRINKIKEYINSILN